ncbi:MAG: hypothetical protein IM328_12690 [Microcystis sp. M034S1]|jgi:hypothetical protein|uniref:plasmid partition protein ParG n=1 Tax=Microcystis sp. M034S1 TaxID=2771111 RepID=UPI00258FFB96|nr:plasmid partition protein ParG [Microcystis sp. M034S1]MCA2910190.1 hypothetical protein [Microcystis sp. M034S1]MCA6510456.1 hypothetical protein [Pseudanabaena sp. M109S1SP2A07QC]MCA6517786.1 hypothetical protein [Pseudanabaena sp. M110S1SP2A07QC]
MVCALPKQDYVMVYLDKDTKRKYKAQCALQGVDMSANAALLIENWLKESDHTKDKAK